MAMQPPPSKRELLVKLLEHTNVSIHLDPRRKGVIVPQQYRNQPQLVLQLGLNFPIPIRDLEIDDEGVRCTLSFQRTPHYCVLPWHAVFAFHTEDKQATVWTEDMPADLIPHPEPAVRKDSPRASRGMKMSSRPQISVISSTTSSEASSPSPATTSHMSEVGASLRDRSTQSESPTVTASSSTETSSDGAYTTDFAASTSSTKQEEAQQEHPSPTPTPAAGSPRRPRSIPPYLRLVK